MKDILSARLESRAFPADAVALYALEGREVISQLFEFQLHVVCKSPEGLDEEALLAEPAALVFYRGDREVRRLFGVVSVVRDALHTETLHMAYTLTFVPRAFRMTLTETSEIFMDLSVPEILKKKLERAGLHEGDDFELRLFASYPPREYVVQYKETDLQFASRLAEHLGISFFFEHRDGRDVLVFSDANSGFQPIEDSGRAQFYPRGEQVGVHRLEGTTRTIPSRYVVKDYNYRTPHVPLMAAATVSDAAGGDIVEYGAHFKTPDEGERIAVIRAEELRAGRKVFEGASDVQALGAGARFMLEGHPRGDVELLLVEVRHRLQQATLNTGRGEEHAYANEFRAIPFATTYRPPRVTPKPRVHGAITGVIDAAAKGQYAEVDEAGRYRVRFLFDTSSAEDGKASRLVRMAQPHAGAGYGFHFPLRSGVEVILTCIDGDPDRPIITGAVPNPHTPSTVDAKNSRRNVIRTGGGNEINIDDTEGEERIKISTPYGGSCLQLGAPNTPESGAAMTTLDAYSQVAVAGINTATSVMNSVADTMSCFAATDITNFAGVSNVLSNLDKIEKLTASYLAVAKSALDIPKKYDAWQQARMDEAAVRAEEAAKRLEQDAVLSGPPFPSPPPMVQGSNGVARPMTLEEWNEQIALAYQGVPEARAAAKEAKDAAEARKKASEADETNVALKRLGAAVEFAASSAGAFKSGRTLISAASKLMKKAGDKSAAAVAQMMATAANGPAATGRVASPVLPIASPSCINAAVTTSAVIGQVNAFVGGAANAALASEGVAVVAGVAAAALKSSAVVEMASGARALITSKDVDIRALDDISMHATSGATIEAKKFTTRTTGEINITSNGSTIIESRNSMNMKAGPELNGHAQRVSLKASNKAALEVNTWNTTVSTNQASIGDSNSNCTLKSGSAVLKCGSTITCQKSGVTVKASTIDLKGRARVRLNGNRIDLG
ncbi:uncharacterized protein SOCEGT47_029590 [Sorangium cellulosum]|uniref:Gp5/Type VI secretion system Vgr protein OB-fold domain-containing protein n=1 Tax=Sorangium cellulosum TaxID=56 RepID=A0A4P2Q0M9_SORCE|nr:type VI secretion system tip protein TssI/VgrG [Sorangium cellulosum]AUX22456.1 uncharacterized protein SOCEGT47_029590 [Sorangium cellulosum]